MTNLMNEFLSVFFTISLCNDFVLIYHKLSLKLPLKNLFTVYFLSIIVVYFAELLLFSYSERAKILFT